MGKRGPQPQPDEVKELRGTMRKDRSHPREVPVLDGDLRIPSWLEGDALDLWHEKLATYRERGMSVVGCEFDARAVLRLRGDDDPVLERLQRTMGSDERRSAAEPAYCVAAERAQDTRRAILRHAGCADIEEPGWRAIRAGELLVSVQGGRWR